MEEKLQYKQYAEMEYKNDYGSQPSLLAEGYYDKHHFVILNQGGSHPTAYISMNNFPLVKEHAIAQREEEGLEYDRIPLNVHGGPTFYGTLPKKEDGDHEERFVGWDYAHYRDRAFGEDGPENGREYTVKDILKDVVSGVESLKEEERKLRDAETKAKSKNEEHERNDTFSR